MSSRTIEQLLTKELGITPREYHDRYHEAAGGTDNGPALLR